MSKQSKVDRCRKALDQILVGIGADGKYNTEVSFPTSMGRALAEAGLGNFDQRTIGQAVNTAGDVIIASRWDIDETDGRNRRMYSEINSENPYDESVDVHTGLKGAVTRIHNEVVQRMEPAINRGHVTTLVKLQYYAALKALEFLNSALNAPNAQVLVEEMVEAQDRVSALFRPWLALEAEGLDITVMRSLYGPIDVVVEETSTV